MRVRVLREEAKQANTGLEACMKAATSSRKALEHLEQQEKDVLIRLQKLQQEHELLR